MGYCCAVCGFEYRHEGMASRCVRTRLCRQYNMPPRAVRDVWTLAGGAASLAIFQGSPVLDTAQTALPQWKLAAACREAGDAVFDWLHVHRPVSVRVRAEMHSALMLQTSHIWAPEKTVHMCYLGEVLTAVTHDAVHAAAKRGYPADLRALLEQAASAQDALYEFFEPDEDPLDNFTQVMNGISRLEQVVLGVQPEPRLPSLYLVDGWQLVSAHGREEARRLLARFGKAHASIAGIAHGEKFEDGSTAAELLRKFPCPAVIGQMEA